MTRAEAEALALKREQHKPKSITTKRWAAVHNSVKGWHVALAEDHVAIAHQARDKARQAFYRNDLQGLLEAASELLLARCHAELDPTPPEVSS